MSTLLPIKKVNLLFTACNLSCPMCSMNANAKDVPQILRDYPGAAQGAQLTLDEYKKFFADVKKYNPMVSIAGGEPTVFRRLPELLEYIGKTCGYPVGVTTNGTTRSEEMAEGIANHANAVTVSVDGMKTIHESIRGDGNYDRAISFMRKMLEYRKKGSSITLYSLFALQLVNHMEMMDVVRFLMDDIGVDGMTISSLVFSTQEILSEHAKWVAERQLDEKYIIQYPRGGVSDYESLSGMNFEAIWQMKKEVNSRYHTVQFEPDFMSLPDMKTYFLTNKFMPGYFDSKCNPSSTQITLLSNGDVLFLPGCFQIKMGNIREQSVDEIWNNAIYNEVRSVLSHKLSPICTHCCANRKEKNL